MAGQNEARDGNTQTHDATPKNGPMLPGVRPQ